MSREIPFFELFAQLQLSPELRSRYTGIALEKAERLEDLINEFL